jgi:ribosomal protein S6
MVIVLPDIGEQAQEEVFQKVTKKIESLDGKIIDAKVWAKERILAYPLKAPGAHKKKYLKGCYWLVTFSLDTDKLADLKETIRLEEKILRNIILSRESVKAENIPS